jgi:RNA polymerase sigma factor (TIGR02999 family)
MQPTAHDITTLLLAWGAGDRAALDRLIPLVYDELHRLAQSYMRRERAGQTLQATALIHEAWLRLIDVRQVEWQNRAHFFGMAARVMRQILVAAARERGWQKRGGGTQRISLDETLVIDAGRDEDLVALDEALNALAAFDARKAQVVEMRFFGGLTEAEIAATLHVSPETVRRDWRLAKAWLLHKLDGGEPHGT